MKNEFCAILMTCASAREARAIVTSVLATRLIACASIIPAVESHYRWKGKVVRSAEVLVIMKTERRRLKALEREIRRLHSYEVPEIVALPITAGSAPYLEWIRESTR